MKMRSRVLAWLLAGSMVLQGAVPVSASAAGIAEDDGNAAVWEQTVRAGEVLEDSATVVLADFSFDEENENLSRGEIISLAFEEKVEEQLVQPTFITEYPVEISPLAKRMPSNPEFTERFEVFITRREFGNAFSELNDPLDQKERFKKQVEKREAGDE